MKLRDLGHVNGASTENPVKASPREVLVVRGPRGGPVAFRGLCRCLALLLVHLKKGQDRETFQDLN